MIWHVIVVYAAYTLTISLLGVGIISLVNNNMEKENGAENHRAVYPPLVRWHGIAIDKYDVPRIILIVLFWAAFGTWFTFYN